MWSDIRFLFSIGLWLITLQTNNPNYRLLRRVELLFFLLDGDANLTGSFWDGDSTGGVCGDKSMSGGFGANSTTGDCFLRLQNLLSTKKCSRLSHVRVLLEAELSVPYLETVN